MAADFFLAIPSFGGGGPFCFGGILSRFTAQNASLDLYGINYENRVNRFRGAVARGSSDGDTFPALVNGTTDRRLDVPDTGNVYRTRIRI